MERIKRLSADADTVDVSTSLVYSGPESVARMTLSIDGSDLFTFYADPVSSDRSVTLFYKDEMSPMIQIPEVEPFAPATPVWEGGVKGALGGV